MTEKKIQSKALEVNLERTRLTHLDLPEDHQFLLDSTGASHGIYKRTNNFLMELHHTYPNFKVVVKLFREIVLQDYWLYFYALPLLTTGLIFKEFQEVPLSALIGWTERQCLSAYSTGKDAWRYNQLAFFFRRRWIGMIRWIQARKRIQTRCSCNRAFGESLKLTTFTFPVLSLDNLISLT